MNAPGRLLNPAFDAEPMSRPVEACRSCGSPHLRVFADLGEPPIAGRLLLDEVERRAEPRVPLAAAICDDCSLVQLTETLRPRLLYADGYASYDCVSAARQARARALANSLLAERKLNGQPLGRSSLVLAVGSNDGCVLAPFAEAGVTVLGVDPARGQVRAARARRIDTIEDFFTQDLAHSLADRRGKADIVIAGQVLDRAADPNDMAAGIAAILKPDGVAIIEVPYLRDLLDNRAFDAFIHERLCHYSFTSLDALLRRNGLFACRAERLATGGGMLRIRAMLADRADESVTALLAEERLTAATLEEDLSAFAADIQKSAKALAECVRGLTAKGHTIAACGASTRGAALLHAAELSSRDIAFVADANMQKQGCLMAGAHVPVLPPEALFEKRPDYALLLAWDQSAEIIAAHSAWLEAGGTFILPFPEPRFVTAANAGTALAVNA